MCWQWNHWRTHISSDWLNRLNRDVTSYAIIAESFIVYAITGKWLFFLCVIIVQCSFSIRVLWKGSHLKIVVLRRNQVTRTDEVCTYVVYTREFHRVFASLTNSCGINRKCNTRTLLKILSATFQQFFKISIVTLFGRIRALQAETTRNVLAFQFKIS